jgi:hypothetical protein
LALDGPLVAADFLTGAVFLAAVFFAGAFLAGAFLAAAFLAGAFLAAAFLAGAAFLVVFLMAFFTTFLALAATERFVDVWELLEDVRDAGASGSGAGVRFVIRPLQSVNGDMSVDLSGRERSVTKQLLDGAQIRAALKQMRGCGVPQTVRTEVGCALDCPELLVHQGTNRPGVDATPPPAEEKSRSATGGRHSGSGSGEPSIEGLLGGDTVGNGPLLRPLTEYPDRPSMGVEVIDVDPAQLTDTDAGRV